MSELVYCVGCGRTYDEGRFPGVTTVEGEPLCAACAEELAYEHADRMGR
jgi:hypothetical protein